MRKNTQTLLYSLYSIHFYILKHYILDHIRKIVGDFKDIDISLFKINTFKQMCMGEKKLSKPKTQKQSKENKIKSIGNPFILEKKKKID